MRLSNEQTAVTEPPTNRRVESSMTTPERSSSHFSGETPVQKPKTLGTDIDVRIGQVIVRPFARQAAALSQDAQVECDLAHRSR